MIHISKPIQVQCNYDFTKQYSLENILFFDIETTGLSADVSSLYLIGCIYFSSDSFYLKQWFADEYHEEHLLLKAFFEFCKNFETLIHYNGSGFDLPYLRKKTDKLKLSFPLDTMTSIDLYRKIFPYKKFLSVSNIRQKTVEELTGLYRMDPYNGSELIQVYGKYLHGKLKGEQNYNDFLSPLLLHNQEDLSGLLWITSILTFTDDFFKTKPALQSYKIEASILTFYVTFPITLPFSIKVSLKEFYFEAKKNEGLIKVPILDNKIKLFYEDYKNYYYLPMEDYAIHKSVASFVDKKFKKKATKDTCYCWVELNENFLSNTQKQQEYCFQLTQHYIKSNK